MLSTYINFCIVALSIFTVHSSPVPSSKSGSSNNKILYDQRQEGEWNVRADLKNFVILIIPKSSQPASSNPAAAGGSLLDLLFRNAPGRHHLKRINKKHQNADQNNVVPVTDAAIETRHFIEAKSAPYQVDISKTKEEISKSNQENENVVIANSPALTLVKEPAKTRAKRFTRAFVLTVPEDDFVITKTEDFRKIVKKDNNKKKISKTKTQQKDDLKLLGATEQCGPDGYRDESGICRFKKDDQ